VDAVTKLDRVAFELTAHGASRVIRVVTRVIWHACKLIGESSRGGGYFCLADAATGQPFLVILIATAPVGKASKYMNFAVEKARRLAEHPEHVSSWQSRDENNEKYAGAIRGRHFIFSFSGLPQLWDEAAMVVVSERLDEGVNSPAILAASSNPHHPALAQEVPQVLLGF
jgi:hypothetical protein